MKLVLKALLFRLQDPQLRQDNATQVSLRISSLSVLSAKQVRTTAMQTSIVTCGSYSVATATILLNKCRCSRAVIFGKEADYSVDTIPEQGQRKTLDLEYLDSDVMGVEQSTNTAEETGVTTDVDTQRLVSGVKVAVPTVASGEMSRGTPVQGVLSLLLHKVRDVINDGFSPECHVHCSGTGEG